MAHDTLAQRFARLAFDRTFTHHGDNLKDVTRAEHREDIGLSTPKHDMPDISSPWFGDRGPHAHYPSPAEQNDYCPSPFSNTPSPKSTKLDKKLRGRGPSIGFDPQAKLDSGFQHPIRDPPSHNFNREDEPPYHARHRLMTRPYVEEPSSMTTACTISPLQDDLHTLHEIYQDSPTSILNSPAFPFLPDAASSEPWSVYRQGSVRSAKALSSRHGSLRRASRQSSRRSTSNSFSPASAFLSKWASEPTTVETFPDDEGQAFGDQNEYMIGRQIAVGGFGTVKETFSFSGHGTRTKLAVKIVRKPGATKTDSSEHDHTGESAQHHFEHEISIWRHLSHRNILELRHVFDSDFATYCVMDYNNGGTLYDAVVQARKLGCRGLQPQKAKSYAFQLACALRYLHCDIRVVHRDVKLENCLLDTSHLSSDDSGPGRLRLCDFGLSDFITLDSPRIDAVDSALGTTTDPEEMATNSALTGSLDYVSPEVILASRSIETRLMQPTVDIWAYGVCIFAILTGERPFKHTMHAKLIEIILQGELDEALVRSCIADHKEDADHILALLHGCLTVNAEDRWTISQVLDSPWFADCGDPL